MINNNKIMNVKKTLEKDYNKETLDRVGSFEEKRAEFVLYEKGIINSINQTAGGTKANVVGQMSDIVPVFRDYCIENSIDITPEEWKNWYTKNYPNRFNDSIEKLKNMLNNFQFAISNINKETLIKWLNNFLFIENIEGLLVQEDIMKFIIKKYPSFNVRAAAPEEESKNIDIIVNEVAYQVKPLTSKQGSAFNQKWGTEKAIWYTKATKDGKKIYNFWLPKNLTIK